MIRDWLSCDTCNAVNCSDARKLVCRSVSAFGVYYQAEGYGPRYFCGRVDSGPSAGWPKWTTNAGAAVPLGRDEAASLCHEWATFTEGTGDEVGIYALG